MATRLTEPQDAHRGTVAAIPADADEAAADRELADAERAVALGTASSEQRARVEDTSGPRSQEERRRQWVASRGR